MILSVELNFATMLDDAALDEIAAQGITAISAPSDFVESLPKETLRRRAAALSSRGIGVDTSHPRFGLYNSEYSMVNQYTAQRGLYLERLKDFFERMAILGAKTAPIHTGGSCLPMAPEWALDLCADSVRAILPAAAGAGIVLALENTFFTVPMQWNGGSGGHSEAGASGGGTGCAGASEAGGADAIVDAGGAPRPPCSDRLVYDDVGKLCALIDAQSSPYVRGCYDVGHAHYLGDVAADHAAMGDRIVLYHIHDNSREYDMHLAPGYGTLDWELFGGLIHANKAEYFAFIEARPWALGTNGHMIRETRALLSGGRRGEHRRCLKCGRLILHDEKGAFCSCKQ